jgi:GNAT superfamily N-acetyltransferase
MGVCLTNAIYAIILIACNILFLDRALAMEIRRTQIEDIRSFREQYLLGGRPKSAAAFPADFAPDTIHLAGLIDSSIIGAASFFLESHSDFGVEKQFRLRQMAVATHLQGNGYGKDILQTGIEMLRNLGCKLLWCHARQAAFGFYESQGFQPHGPFFDVVAVGAHKIMYLNL